MSEISLREYLAKLEGLLNANAADEVIHHGRHILQFSPKNVAAYRLLGRALLFNQRWDEAGAALRRVLTILPTDFAAHLGMSEVYDRAKQGDEAIWHLERAFEQSPNSREVIDALRALYRRYRQIDPKIQLTSAAIARQYLNNAQYDQAIEALRSAISRSPERIELKLMLAQALWESGKPEDGAELALDVLEVLPDSLEANVILTQLWLDEDRPSDAQRYLNRIESVDPYRALEIAQGDAPDDAFQIDELDYQRFAKTQLSTARPDWMTEISADISTGAEDLTDAEWSNWMSGMAPPQKDETPVAATNFEENVFSEISALSPVDQPDFSIFEEQQENSFAPTNPDNDPMAWLRGSGVEIYDDETEAPQFESFDFSSTQEEASPTAWMDASFNNDEVVNADIQPDDELPTWMQDESSRADAFVPTLSSGDEPEHADLSWMQNDAQSMLDEAMGVEQLTNADSEFPDFEFFDAEENEADQPVNNFAPSLDTADFRNTFESAPSFEAPNDLDTPETPTVPDWLNTYQEDTPASPAEPDFSAFESTSEQAQAEPNFDDFTFEASLDDHATTPQREGLTGLLKNANLDWLNAAVSDDANEAKFESNNADFPPESEADDEWMASFGVTPTAKTDAEAAPDWLTALDDSSNNAEENLFAIHDFSANNEASEAEIFTGAPQNEVEFDMPTHDDFDMPSDEDFDWLTNETSSEDDKIDAFASIEDTSSSKPVMTDEAANSAHFSEESTPDWLSSFNSESDAEAETNFNFEQPTDDDFASLFGEEDIETTADEIVNNFEEVAADAPDWLSDLKSAELEEVETETNFNFEQPTDDDLASLFGEGVEGAADEIVNNFEEVTADAPDWLSELKPVELEEVATETNFNFEQPTDDDLASLFGEGVEGAADEIVNNFEEVTADAPDWLSDLKSAEIEGVETETSFNFEQPTDDDLASLFGEGVEDAADEIAHEIEEVAADAPDWLSDLKPVEFEEVETESSFNFEQPANADDDFASLFGEGVEGAADEIVHEVEEVTADAPDWLSNLKPAELEDAQTETSFNFEQPANADDDFASLFGEGVEGAADEIVNNFEEVAADAPDWLSELKPVELEAEAETSFNFEQPTDDDFASLFGEGVEGAADEIVHEVEEVTADAPDWLSELKPAELEAEQHETSFNFEQPANADDDFASLFGEGVEDAADEIVNNFEEVTADAPDWLSDLKPVELEEVETETSFNFEQPANANDDVFASRYAEDIESATELSEEINDPLGENADDEFATLFGVATENDHSGDLFSGISGVLSANLHEEAEQISDISDDIAQNFGNEFEVSGDAVATEMPDWLTEMRPEETLSSGDGDEFEADEDALFSYETDAITDDLFAATSLVATSAESEQFEDESMNDFDFSNTHESPDEPENTGGDFNFDETEDSSITESSEFEWMAEEELEASAMDSEGSTAVATPASITPEWDGEEIPVEAQIEDPLFGAVLNDQIFEPSELEEADDVMPIEPILDGSAADDPEDDYTPEWVSETERSAEEMVAEGNVTGTPEFIEEEIVAAENAAIEHGVEDYAFEDEYVEGDFEEAATSNAPDWLNAMVPGIDIDFEAEEDEQVESEFLEEPVTIAPDTHHTSRRDGGFGWLVDMVEEEELSDAPITSPETSGASESSRFSFSRKPSWLNFSRQPSWLAGKSEATAPSAAETQANDHADFFEDDDFPDWPADDDDKDAPEWLK